MIGLLFLGDLDVRSGQLLQPAWLVNIDAACIFEVVFDADAEPLADAQRPVLWGNDAAFCRNMQHGIEHMPLRMKHDTAAIFPHDLLKDILHRIIKQVPSPKACDASCVIVHLDGK